ncbi:MAG TPA: hypothetical protein VNE62_04710 [Actinomycetota bacterium]|nr:hypothetical protein [Actinomycetota bacterium]
MVVTAVLLAACGGGDESPQSATDDGATSTQAPAGGKKAGATDICKLFPPEKVAAFLKTEIGFAGPSHSEDETRVTDFCKYAYREQTSTSGASIATVRFPNVEAAQVGFQQKTQSSTTQPVTGIGDEAKTHGPRENASARFGTVILTVSIVNVDRTAAAVERHVAQLKEFLRIVAEHLKPILK